MFSKSVNTLLAHTILTVFFDTITEKFARDGIDVITGARVLEVKKNSVVVMDKRSKKKTEKSSGVCIWSTGLGKHPFTAHLQAQVGQNLRRRALSVDSRLRVRSDDETVPANSMYAIGDCADVKSGGEGGDLELVDRATALFKEADVDKSGGVDKAEFEVILKKLALRYPQIKTLLPIASEAASSSSIKGDSHLQDIMDKFDDSKTGTLSLKEFTKAMAEADSRLTSHPATAQVANQQGEYIAKTLNAVALERKNKTSQTSQESSLTSDDGKALHPGKPFKYTHLGSFATLGSEQAVMELPGDFISTGFGTMMLWYGVYMSNCVSWRNKFLVAGDWFKKIVWGRDTSRF